MYTTVLLATITMLVIFTIAVWARDYLPQRIKVKRDAGVRRIAYKPRNE